MITENQYEHVATVTAHYNRNTTTRTWQWACSCGSTGRGAASSSRAVEGWERHVVRTDLAAERAP